MLRWPWLLEEKVTWVAVSPNPFLGAKSHSPYKRRNQVIFLGETKSEIVEMNLSDYQPWTLFWS